MATSRQGSDHGGPGPASNRKAVARWIDAFNHRDLESLCGLAHDDVVVQPSEYAAPPGTVFHGHRGIHSFIRAVAAQFPALRAEPVEFRELDGAVLVTLNVVREPETDPAGLDHALLCEMDGGRVRQARAYFTESEALEVAARSALGGFHAVFDSAVEPMLLIDDAWRIVNANRAALRFFGLDRDHLGKRAVTDLMSGESPEQTWLSLREHGRALGTIDVLSASGRRTMDFWATAEFRPGQHLVLLREPAPLPPPRPALLTAREREIFELLARGQTAPKIAERLVLSPATIRTHVQNAVGKLGAATRVQAIARAIALGEIKVEPDAAQRAD